jgi:class 3 adenylate cyclase/tetratricopeptide (TPR) repeat protein
LLRADRVAERFAAPLAYTPPHLAQRILASRSALEGEHKLVTVMFCDLADSTGLASRLGAEAMYELLNRFFDIALEELHRYEGTINQFLGDGFMALFGAPLALEHHESEAVLAALALRRTLDARASALLPAAPAALRVRIGLNTGRVVVGKIGDNLRMDYTAVGDTTNVAARLQSLAAPGDILISDSTWERARAVVGAEPLGAQHLRGRAAPVRAHRVTAERAGRAVPGGLGEHPLSAFVAREHELAALENALAEAEQSRGQAVGVVSEPGMGKSRLLHEFRRRLADRRVTYLEGRCVSYGRAIPYLPVLGLLRAGFGLVDTDPPEETAAKVTARLEAAGMAAAEEAPFLLHLLGLKAEGGALEKLTPELIQRRTIEAVRQLCVRASQTGSLVVVIEDLHWADRASEDLLEILADTLGGTAILLLTTYRPGHPPAWGDKSFFTQISLRPLPDHASRALLRSTPAGGGLSEEAVGAVLARGEGNPLFLEELARSVSEVAGDRDAVPTTLQGVLAARIDRLRDDAKHLLQAASVIGREFGAGLLASVWSGRAEPESLLRELVNLEFLHVRPSGPTHEYVFKHALTRDAAYDSLLEGQRRRYHGAVGAALEQAYDDRRLEIAELLAHHYGRSGDPQKSVDWTLAAAEKAQRRWANAEALAFFQAALDQIATMPDTTANRLRRIDAVLKQAEVRFASGQHTEELRALEDIEGIVEETADPPRRAAWHYWMGFLHVLTGGSLDRSRDHCRNAGAIAEAEGLDEMRAFVGTCLTQVHVCSGSLLDAVEAGERALAIFERSDNRWWACRALAQLSSAANALGEWERGMGYCRRALEHAVALEDLRLRVSALIRLGSTCIQRGDWPAGLRYCDDAAALGPGPYDAAAVNAIRGYGLVKAGDQPTGIALLEEALAWYERSRLPYTSCQFGLWLAEARLLAGDVTGARRVARQVLNTSERSGYGHLQSLASAFLRDPRLDPA